MKNDGLTEIFSHSSRHLSLNRYPVKKAKKQVADSFMILDEKLNKNAVKVFAYPYGASSPELISALKQNGVQIQVHGIGLNRIDSLSLSHVKRFEIPYSMTGYEILQLIEKESDLIQ